MAGLVSMLVIALVVSAGPARSASHDISILDGAFDPAEISVLTGEPVTWTNRSTHDHTVTSDSGTELDSGTLAAGEAYGHVFETPGTFTYHSATEGDDMHGTVIVQAATVTPAPTGPPTPTPPSGTLPPNFSPFPTHLLTTPTPTPTATPTPTDSGSTTGGRQAVLIGGAVLAAALLAGVIWWRRPRPDRR